MLRSRLRYLAFGFLLSLVWIPSLCLSQKIGAVPNLATDNSFIDVTDSAGVGQPGIGIGFGVADFNNDSRQDIYLVNRGKNILFQNQGQPSWRFTDITNAAKVAASSDKGAGGVAFIDYNNDGFTDILTYHPLELFENQGRATFENVTAASKIQIEGEISGAAFGDYDNDGDLDLYLVTFDAKFSNRLFENQGPPAYSFIDRTSIAKVGAHSEARGCIFLDYNNDDFQDIYTINQNQSNQLYENQKDGTFQNVAASKNLALTGLFTGLATADYDNDGDLDLYLTVSAGPNLLFQNSGPANFTFSKVQVGVSSINNGFTSAWGDYDNDGYLDLFVCNPYGSNALYRNNGDGTFTDVAKNEGLNQPSGSVANFWDFNNDGQLDIYTISTAGGNKLFKNIGLKYNWIKFKLFGIESNREALGARIIVHAADIHHLRELNGQHLGAFSQNSQPEHFGLGSATLIDSLHIKWPSGSIMKLLNIPVNRNLVIKEDEILPQIPILQVPAKDTALVSSPIFKWEIPNDANNDSLNFRFEFSEDSLFESSATFDSWLYPNRFSPHMPVAAGKGVASFMLAESLEDGTYWWRVFAYDQVGLSLPTPARKFIIDTVPPTNPTSCTEQHGIANAMWHNITAQPIFILEGANDDGSGIAGYLVYWGNDPEGASSQIYEDDTLRVPTVSDGQTFLRVQALDRAGNQAESWSTLFIYKYDATPPTGTIASSVLVSDTITFYIHWENTANDEGGSGLSGFFAIKRKVDDGAWEDWISDYKGTSIFDTGTHGHRYAYEVAAKDVAGNIETFTGNAETIVLVDTTKVDEEPPPAPINLLASNASPSPWQSQPDFEVSWIQPYDRSGIARSYYKLTSVPTSNDDTTAAASGSPTILINATESYGQWLYLWLEDGLGNHYFMQYDSVLLRYDPEPPVIIRTVLLAADYGFNWYNPDKNQSLGLVLEYSEHVPQMVQIWIDTLIEPLAITELSGGIEQKIEYEVDISGLIDGGHSLMISMTDSAGNTTTDTSFFYTDKTPPVDTRVSSPDTSNNLQILVRWQKTGSDRSGSGLAGTYDVQVRQDDGEWQLWLREYSGESALFSGEHGHTYYFEVAGYDRVGNLEKFLDIPESFTCIDTTAQMSQTPPEKPILMNPIHATFLNTSYPILTWQVPVDANNDSLHFRVEISLDSLFGPETFYFKSHINARGFSPLPPIAPGSGTMQFLLPIGLSDTTWWWRVTAYDGVEYGLISQPFKFTNDTQLPMNPKTCIDKNGPDSSFWQNSHNQPNFEWQAASDVGSGVAGYLIYWGFDAEGESTIFSESLNYKPTDVSSGKHFLRIRTKDKAGNLSEDWTTLFIFKYDNIPPRGAKAWTPRFSQGETFVVRWGNTAVDSGGAGLTGRYDLYMNIDSSANWIAHRLNFKGDSVTITGEMEHIYAFEIAARDSAGNIEPLTGIPETSILVAPPNEAPEAPSLVSPPDGSFIFSVRPKLVWNVPKDADNNLLHFRIEISHDSAFSQISHIIDSGKNPEGFMGIPASQSKTPTANFTFHDSLADGHYWWRVSAWDGLQFGSISNHFQFILDTSPPLIQHVPVTSAAKETPIQITVATQDSLSGVAETQLIYKQGGWNEINRISILSESAIIPGYVVTSRGIEYAIKASDRLGNSSHFPENGFISVSVVMEGDGIVKPTLQPTGEAQTAYRMISVPLSLEKPDPLDVLQDDLGPYDRTKWRMFSYCQHQFTEYGSTNDFEPGRSFWLIVKDGSKNIDSGPGRTVTTLEPYQIQIDSASWTMVANPFNFPVPLSNLSFANGDPLLNMITYDGQWRIKTELTQLDPWEGYMVKAMGSTALIIDPRAANWDSLGKQTIISDSDISGLWEIQIKARCQKALDHCNYLGVKANASDEWDTNDLFETPIIGEYIMVRFPHLDWIQYPDYYTTDYRSIDQQGSYWDFETCTSLKASEVNLEFVQTDSIPSDFQIILIDRKMKIQKNLRDACDYHYTSETGAGVRGFRLIVGEQAYVEEHNLGAMLMPVDYHLAQNYPNPFNHRTLIRFFLPQAERINLIIYNILGVEVTRLLDNASRGAGVHTIAWNGKNENGLSVASGVYFYILKTTSGKVNLIRKMVFVR